MQGWNPQKPAQLDGNDTTTISYILCHFANYVLRCEHMRVVEGSGVGSAGCGVQVDVHGE